MSNSINQYTSINELAKELDLSYLRVARATKYLGIPLHRIGRSITLIHRKYGRLILRAYATGQIKPGAKKKA